MREITSHGGAEAEVFLGAGHFPFDDDPERFVDVLNDVVASTRPAELGQERIEALLRRGQKHEGRLAVDGPPRSRAGTS